MHMRNTPFHDKWSSYTADSEKMYWYNVNDVDEVYAKG